jgi:hypothetical protein
MTTEAQRLYDRISNARERIKATNPQPGTKDALLFNMLSNHLIELGDYLVRYEQVNREGLDFCLPDEVLNTQETS